MAVCRSIAWHRLDTATVTITINDASHSHLEIKKVILRLFFLDQKPSAPQ